MDEEDLDVQHSVDIDGLTIGFDIIYLPAGPGEPGEDTADIKFAYVSDPDEFLAAHCWEERFKFYDGKVDWAIDNYTGRLLQEVQ
jgi:hypothetical protein